MEFVETLDFYDAKKKLKLGTCMSQLAICSSLIIAFEQLSTGRTMLLILSRSLPIRR